MIAKVFASQAELSQESCRLARCPPGRELEQLKALERMEGMSLLVGNRFAYLPVPFGDIHRFRHRHPVVYRFRRTAEKQKKGAKST